jgi:hypothetical protein
LDALKIAYLNISEDISADLISVREQLHKKPGVVFLFLPSNKCQEDVATSLFNLFNCPVGCCSSASSIYLNQSSDSNIVALSIDAKLCKGHTIFISNMKEMDEIEDACTKVTSLVNSIKEKQSLLSVFLADGLSQVEDMVIHFLSNALSGVPVIGGSSSDDLTFVSAPVYYEGEFHENAATLLLLEMSVDFEVFKIQNFYPTNKRLVITKADEGKRTIYEINGEPALQKYAELVGKKPDELVHADFAEHPLALCISGEIFIRSVERSSQNMAIMVYGHIYEGAVLRIAQSDDLSESTLKSLNQIRSGFQEVYGGLAFECILRKEELLTKPKEMQEVYEYYRQYNLIGCHTYGEQFLGHHVNQSVTGVLFGRKK